ncbi:putative translation initiation factor SUI1 [Ostreococcus tauri]|uniref:Putative translation initiation factor SUI1 n=1 Tax=Ostreococcus tauri TaxID=70448 RepID=A0A1Y5I7H9_OSTTA|nr:putative translation initiation factor SUI1 [Ostreococcus tauri]
MTDDARGAAANDPFANEALDFGDAEDKPKKKEKKGETADSVQGNYIHIRMQQRNGRKSLTTVQGLNPKINLKLVVKECKKKFNCNGCIVEDSEHGDIVQLQGDQRKNIAQFLVDERISKKALIKVHGAI